MNEFQKSALKRLNYDGNDEKSECYTVDDEVVGIGIDIITIFEGNIYAGVRSFHALFMD
jgi:hypothetical protein